MTGHMIERGAATDQKKPGNEQTELSNSAGIIFTTSGGQEVMSYLPPMKSLTSSERAQDGQRQRVVLSSSLSAGSGLPHSDSLPAITLTEMRKISRSEEVVGAQAPGKGKPASGRHIGVAMCQQQGGGTKGDEDDSGLELVMPSSKELLKVRQRKKVGISIINNSVYMCTVCTV